MSLNIPNHIAQTEIALGGSTYKGRAIPAIALHTAAVRMGSQVLTLQNACFVPEVGLLRDAGLPECYVPANAWTTGPAHELVALMGGTTFDASNIAPVVKDRKAVNKVARDLFGSEWWGDKNGNSPEKLARQEAAMRELMRPSVAVTPAPETVAPVHNNGLDDLIALMGNPAPVTMTEAPKTDGLPDVFADILAGAEKARAPVAQATEAQPVATDKDSLVAMAVAQHDMPKSAAQRLTASVLESILGL